MAILLSLVLWGLGISLLLINLFFASIQFRWPRVRKHLGSFFTVCGAETSSCAVVAGTPYALLFMGLPNVVAGIPWALSLLGLAVFWAVSGRAVVPWPFLFASVMTVIAAGYLIHALVVVLKQACPLCLASHALHASVAILLWAVWFLER
ncbi:MAG TPA: vitamin K epoxide reductase family protein [Vicinamibacteria bacterium]|jgi:uncharacterized membrane protein|nr:vitamin K epoxide reductase family protein [Vicinamibacteria bacterium]